jgi:hypothetical protein
MLTRAISLARGPADRLGSYHGLVRREDRDALARIHQVARDAIAVGGVLANLVHHTGEGNPVEELVFACCFDLLQRQVTPSRVVTRLQLLKTLALRLHARVDPVVPLGHR